MRKANATKEDILIESILNPLHFALKAQTMLKEKYGFDSVYNEETAELSINTNSINESLDAAIAKREIENDPELQFMQVCFNQY